MRGEIFLCNQISLDIPGTCYKLYPNNIVKLGRFDTEMWIVLFGWYSYGGNREVRGWYLRNKEHPYTIKPLSKPDLDDIILIQ